MPARLASAFTKVGAHVSSINPHGSPVAKVRLLKEQFHYSARRPLKALSNAIRSAQPDLIIPCDDRVVEHLHQLHAQSAVSQNRKLSVLIERSLGSPAGYQVVTNRGELLSLAKDLGIKIPETASLRTKEDLKKFAERHGFPVVLKVDGTWGGTGVRIVYSLGEAEEAFDQLTGPLSWIKTLQHVSSHDFFPVFSRPREQHEQVIAQVYIEGRSANTMLACWEGTVLDLLSVETLFAAELLGSSTIVRTISSPEMENAGRLLVAQLLISGFCGLDFIIDSGSGDACLIELNPRATQNGHLEPGGRQSLVETLNAKLNGDEYLASTFCEETIAFFPHILRAGTRIPVPISSKVFQDIPFDEPELMAELMRRPWNRRHVSSVLYAVGRSVLERSRRLVHAVLK
jgi:carbamoylphosphate synthase large subunit